MADETWRPVVGWEGLYSVSDRGRVFRDRTGRMFSPCLNNNGYPTIRLSDRTRRKSVLVHRLVAEAFIGPVPEGHEVNHKDSNRDNPSLENLEYVTRSQNLKHSYANGVCRRGMRSPRRKLDIEDIREIRRLRGQELGTVVARRFGVSPSHVSLIQRGGSWKGEV